MAHGSAKSGQRSNEEVLPEQEEGEIFLWLFFYFFFSFQINAEFFSSQTYRFFIELFIDLFIELN